MFDIIPILKERRIKFSSVSGEEILLSCPICKKENHFYYNHKKNLCICQKCKWEGNHFSFLVAGLNFSYKEAFALISSDQSIFNYSTSDLRKKLNSLLSNSQESILVDRMFFRIPFPFPDKLIDISVKKYPLALRERGIAFKDAVDLGVKISMANGMYKDRIIFPITTLKNELFVARTSYPKELFKKIRKAYEEREGHLRKELFPRGSFISEMLFLYNEIKKNTGRLFLTEGIYDSLKVNKFGEFSTALFNSSVSDSQAILISETKFDEIILMLDGDVPLRRIKKCVKLLSNICIDKIVYPVFLPKDKDPDDLNYEEFKEIVLPQVSKKRLNALDILSY